MSDALRFPVLAASALTQAIGFLLRRAEVVLDRRAGRAGPSEPQQAEQVPSAVAGDPGDALDFDPAKVTAEQAERLETLTEALGLYAERGSSIDGQDERLRKALGRLRSCLEEVYGRQITFVGEERPASGRRIVSRVEDVHGVARALSGR
ncbi:hypothetical protein GCM10010207_82120 [Streptomyces atratus]|nr:hypothetical protein GCM10010207_82120 [Streptomyces atratus]